MEYFIGFGIGIIFAVVGNPLLQTIGEIIYTVGEWIKSNINVHIVANNCDMNVMQQDMEQNNTNCIGFKAPPNVSDLPDEDDDDCDNCNKSNKIGFNGGNR